jgi:N-acetylglutamate synthase-like GNAT family acetyltransferase
VGGKLLAPVLARADADGLPAYLETQKEENLAFYGRHGFEVVQEVRLPSAPPIWAMQRTPR